MLLSFYAAVPEKWRSHLLLILYSTQVEKNIFTYLKFFVLGEEELHLFRLVLVEGAPVGGPVRRPAVPPFGVVIS